MVLFLKLAHSWEESNIEAPFRYTVIKGIQASPSAPHFIDIIIHTGDVYDQFVWILYVCVIVLICEYAML
jgi:hypothetical protein